MSSASAATNSQEPPSKNKPAKEGTSNLPFPDDLKLDCLSRVSRLHYPALSLVSKSLRSFLYSPELYQSRSLLKRTEICLYVCLRFPFDRNPRWFTLCRKPDKLLTSKKESSGNLLVPVSIPNSPPVKWSSVVAVGPTLYAISGPINDSPCSCFSFLDCRTHTWVEAPTMRLASTNREYDGHMYLAGSCESPDSLNCVEVFNKKTRTWTPVPPEKGTFEYTSLEGKIYMIVSRIGVSGKKCLCVKPKELTSEVLGLDTDEHSFCVINNIWYCYHCNGKFTWFDNFGGGDWKEVKGLQGLSKFASYSVVKLVDYGGKMVVLWDKYVPGSGCKEKMIWCAEITLERRNNEEIWGKVEWFDAVLTVPKSYKYVCATAATV